MNQFRNRYDRTIVNVGTYNLFRSVKQLWSKSVRDKEVVEDGASHKLRKDLDGSDPQFLESSLKQRRISLLVY